MCMVVHKHHKAVSELEKVCHLYAASKNCDENVMCNVGHEHKTAYYQSNF